MVGFSAVRLGFPNFNEETEKHGLKPLRDQRLWLDDNVYQAIKDTYEEKYEAGLRILDSFSLGTTYAMDYVLRPLDSTVRKDMAFLPGTIWWSALYQNTPEIQDKW